MNQWFAKTRYLKTDRNNTVYVSGMSGRITFETCRLALHLSGRNPRNANSAVDDETSAPQSFKRFPDALCVTVILTGPGGAVASGDDGTCHVLGGWRRRHHQYLHKESPHLLSSNGPNSLRWWIAHWINIQLRKLPEHVQVCPTWGSRVGSEPLLNQSFPKEIHNNQQHFASVFFIQTHRSSITWTRKPWSGWLFHVFRGDDLILNTRVYLHTWHVYTQFRGKCFRSQYCICL